jgi:uncharacterized protein YcnI
MNTRSIIFGVFAAGFLITTSVSAHVTVKPNQVGVGVFQSFSVGVPVEKDVPTVGVRLVIPEGLEYVTPNVKPGWKITVTKDGTGEDAKVTEINWTGGSIPAGQRDDFVFSAKAPIAATNVSWKAYQTYRDGTVVSWDQDPTLPMTETAGPYSTTAVVDDLAADEPKEKNNTSLTLSIIALVLSVIAIGKAKGAPAQKIN